MSALPESAPHSFVSDLHERGLVYQATPELSDEKLSSSKSPLYIGYDPSAASLHAGSLIPLLGMDRYRRQGGQIIMLFGGATGLIGDPSGKDEERTLEREETIVARIDELKKQASEFFGRTEGPEPIYVNNIDWYRNMGVLEFLRDVGKSFSVNQMLTRDSIRSRIENREQGISFTEFSYVLLQSFDYVKLFELYGCRLQMGASDQWGNIVSGVDLIRRRHGASVDALTLPLLTNAAGKKYGKSEKGAVWLNPNLTSPYSFYQFWLGMDDGETVRFLKWLTDFPVEQIDRWAGASEAEKRENQVRLAMWLTQRVHGRRQADLVRLGSEALFRGNAESLSAEVIALIEATVPCLRLPWSVAAPAADVLLSLKAVSSKSEVRRLVTDRGLSANNRPIETAQTDLRVYSNEKGPVIISKGKSSKFLVLFE